MHFLDEYALGWSLCGKNNVKLTKNPKNVTCHRCLAVIEEDDLW